MANAPFPIDPELTSIAIAYQNGKLIADDVLPRLPPMTKEEFKWWKFNLGETFTIPDTKVGRRSAPNKVEFSATQETSSTEDFGLDDDIPQADIDNAGEGYNPQQHGVMGLTDLVLLDREVRTSNLFFDPSSYSIGNTTTLAGTSQFNDPASDPIGVIMNALDAMVMRATHMAIGRPAYSQMIRNPKIVKAAHGNEGDSGVATREYLAELFELQEVYVGEAWVNTTRKGQPVNLARAWGKHLSLFYKDGLANPVMSGTRTTFGFTAQKGQRVAGQMPDPDIGLHGGVRIRSGESVKEIIAAPDLGYLIQNAVA